MGVGDNVPPTTKVVFYCITDENRNQHIFVGFSLKYSDISDILRMNELNLGKQMIS
jgi:hypothetical protein